MRAQTHLSATPPRGFSLVELLAVIAIIAVLASVVTPAFSSAVESNRISMATQFVMGEINAARAAAIAQNKPIEVCLLRGKSGRPNFFEQMALRSVEQDGTKQWLNKNRKLPDGITISGHSDLSTVVGSQTEQTNPRGEVEICLLISPSGEMSLPVLSGQEPTEYYLTLASLADLIQAPEGTFPKNFATVSIDPRNSQTTLHRP